VTPEAALAKIKQAIRTGRYYVHQHAERRMRARRVTVFDIKHGISVADRIEAYTDRGEPSPPSTTSWRLDSRDLDGDELRIGVDLSVDHLGGHVVVITVF
jgi:hypothetical protein